MNERALRITLHSALYEEDEGGDCRRKKHVVQVCRKNIQVIGVKIRNDSEVRRIKV